MIAAYYYDALRFENVFYEKHFQKAVEKLKDKLLVYLKNYLNTNSTNYKTLDDFFKNVGSNHDKFECMVYSSTKQIYDALEIEYDPKEIILRINEFIMLAHEKMRQVLGYKIFTFSERDLKALNYIDISKPLDEQKKIIENKIKEIENKHKE